MSLASLSVAKEERNEILPQLRTIKNQLHCNDLRLDLNKRPMSLRLVRAFCEHPEMRLSRNDLINIVYAGFDPESKSPRFRHVLGQNITKLISRVRILAETKFNHGVKPWIEFFIYDTPSESWSFYRLTNEYVQEMAKKLQREASNLSSSTEGLANNVCK